MKHKNFLAIGLLVFALFSCKKDNNGVTIRDYNEVAVENERDIQTYLKTHFAYLDTNNNVVIDTIAGANASQTSLLNDTNLKKKTLKVRITDNSYLDHTMYYIIFKEGTGEQATVADRSYVLYKGQTLKNKVFENAKKLTQNNWFDLLGDRTRNNNGMIYGFREAVALLKAAPIQDLPENQDGTLSLPSNYGIGLFIMPAALAYYTGSTNIPAYSPVVFEINLLKTEHIDHDADGIPSINEINHQEDGIISYPDCNGNGVVDYLDSRKCN
ncbi:MAG: hypothetical protein Q3983_03465 [Capnocytophaga sp.]|nr:hypothetical protein [Capnocytophaga sp.]